MTKSYIYIKGKTSLLAMKKAWFAGDGCVPSLGGHPLAARAILLYAKKKLVTEASSFLLIS